MPKAKRLKMDNFTVCRGRSPDGKEEFTIFYSEKDPFSNFYPAEFSIGSNKFLNSEQYFHYMKAGKELSFWNTV